MGRLLFSPPAVGAGDAVLIATDDAGTTPADIVSAGGGPAVTGGVLHASGDGSLPRFLGPAAGTATLYALTLDYRGQVAGAPVTLTGVDLDAVAAPTGGSMPVLWASAGIGPIGMPDAGPDVPFPLNAWVTDPWLGEDYKTHVTVTDGVPHLMGSVAGSNNGLQAQLYLPAFTVGTVHLTHAEMVVGNADGSEWIYLTYDPTAPGAAILTGSVWQPGAATWTIAGQVGTDLVLGTGPKVGVVRSTAGGTFFASFMATLAVSADLAA